MASEAEKPDLDKATLSRVLGSAPWLKPVERKRYRVKFFKSGNSLAMRLPAELGLKPGTEVELEVENGEHFSFELPNLPKRKLNVAKFWGILPDLELIAPEDRVFDEPRRPWDDPDWPDERK